MSDYVPIPGYLYILHNPSFEEDTYKLGRAQDLDQRKNGYATPYVRNSEYLHTSSVLLDSVLAEKMLEEKLADVKVRKDREFYKCSVDRIKICFTEIEAFFKENNTIEKLQSYAKPIVSLSNKKKNNVNSKCTCDACGKTFTLNKNLKRHLNQCNIIKYLKENENDNKQHPDINNDINTEIKILQLKLDELAQLIKDKDIKNEILQLKLDYANQLIIEKDERITRLQHYMDYYVITQNNSSNAKSEISIKITNRK